MSVKTPKGRRCVACKTWQDYRAFSLAARKCKQCHTTGVGERFDRTCAICRNQYESGSQRAKYCSDPCRKVARRRLARWRRRKHVGHGARS